MRWKIEVVILVHELIPASCLMLKQGNNSFPLLWRVQFSIMDLIMAAHGGPNPPTGPFPTTDHADLRAHHNHDHSQTQNSNPKIRHASNMRDTVIRPTPRRFRGKFTIDANPNTNTKKNANTNANGQSLRGQGSGEASRRSRRKPGRPRGSKNKPKPPIIVTRDITPNTLTSHVIEVGDGGDIMEGVASFARIRQRGVCVLSGNGCVSNVTISQLVEPDASPDQACSTLQGRFGILSLSGTFLPPPFQPPTSSMTVYLAGREGQVVGGHVVGLLRASGPVIIMAASFGNVVYERVAGAVEGEGNAAGLVAPMQDGSSGSGSGSGIRVDGPAQPQPQLHWQVQPEEEEQPAGEQLEQQQQQHEEDQPQMLGDRMMINGDPANSDDLLDGLPSNIMSSCQLSPPNHDEVYWAGSVTGSFAFLQ
ncbi:hypothetical protein Ancab_037738 [Ancistrocladus abbreviatus]